ncbi:hypothetical protein [Bosea sp. ANAM02]|uniref:hypothetical protein n=1 Tax=Bosea sp. ANAM02 TaxID=2020412 RepID=UPI001567A7F6|nr:hypothetical protein [Bosea sp. ANAM02]
MPNTVNHPFDLTPGVARPTGRGALALAFRAKTRSVLPRSRGASWPGPGMIGLVSSEADKRELVSRGAYIDSYKRLSIPRSEAAKDEWQPFVPLIARKVFTPLMAEMIPESAFGASLTNLLTEAAWKEIRQHAYRAAGHVCQCCGESSGPLECHEVWSFDDEPGADGWCRQTLRHLLSLCHECHELFHPGLASVRRRSDAVIERIKAVNEWTPNEQAIAAQHNNRLFFERSRKRWALDLSILEADDPLPLKSNWSLNGRSGVLAAQTRTGLSRTRITGLRHGVTLANGETIFEQAPPAMGRS